MKRKTMDLRFMGFDTPTIDTITHLTHILDGEDIIPASPEKQTPHAPSRAYLQEARAMACTLVDVKENPNMYQFIVDMPGMKSGDIKVQVEDENVLVISGERKREEEKESVKYLKMERRVGKFMRKFVLPENVNMDKISAICQDGVLTVNVEKLPPPQPKKPKTIEVKVA